ncbi:hypothetical protein VTO73DRAFT_10349 [Trametes versicolor]
MRQEELDRALARSLVYHRQSAQCPMFWHGARDR